VAKVGTSNAGGTISQQAAVHPWLATDAHAKTKQTNKTALVFPVYKVKGKGNVARQLQRNCLTTSTE
jgi:hypothetical protein